MEQRTSGEMNRWQRGHAGMTAARFIHQAGLQVYIQKSCQSKSTWDCSNSEYKVKLKTITHVLLHIIYYMTCSFSQTNSNFTVFWESTGWLSLISSMLSVLVTEKGFVIFPKCYIMHSKVKIAAAGATRNHALLIYLFVNFYYQTWEYCQVCIEDLKFFPPDLTSCIKAMIINLKYHLDSCIRVSHASDSVRLYFDTNADIGMPNYSQWQCLNADVGIMEV